MEQQDILQTPPPQQPQNLPSLPNATATLVLGILSLMFCFMYGLPGLILGIIGLVLGNKDRTLYRLNPSMFSQSSYNNSNAGRICSLIGVILSALFLLTMVVIFGMIGFGTNWFSDFKSWK